MLRYIISFLVLLISTSALAQTDGLNDGESGEQPEPTESRVHQLRLEIDLLSPLLAYQTRSPQMPYKTHGGLSMDYYWKNELYLVAEGGWGGAEIRYDDLQYDSKSRYLRLGFQKGLFAKKHPEDWDLGFMGLRYGLGQVSISESWYRTDHYFWGPSYGTQPPQQVWLHWMELTGGMRMRLWKGLSCGWTLRWKILANAKQVQALPPAFAAGYGSADRSTGFEMNVFIGYAISWSR